MRLKRINATDGLKQIEFGTLKTDCERDQTARLARPNRVLTPDHGWQPVLEFQKIKTGPTVRITGPGGREITCDPHHRLRTLGGEWVYAGDIDKLDTTAPSNWLEEAPWQPGPDGLVPVRTAPNPVKSEPGPVADLYDIELPAPHAYYTGGFVSHNSIMLCNNAVHQSIIGNNVLLVTFELDAIKTAMRCLGALTKVNLAEFSPRKEMDKVAVDAMAIKQGIIRDKMRAVKAGGAGQIYIVELPPDECSVNHIYAEIHQLKRSRGWVPKAIIIDYLELMVGRRDSDNKDDYTRQKQVANQVRGLARNEKALVFTATQGNRSANDTTQNIDLQKIAESYGKSMSLDYVISLNQTPEEYLNNIIRLWLAKNRNGPKQVSITCNINYNNMSLVEAPF